MFFEYLLLSQIEQNELSLSDPFSIDDAQQKIRKGDSKHLKFTDSDDCKHKTLMCPLDKSIRIVYLESSVGVIAQKNHKMIRKKKRNFPSNDFPSSTNQTSVNNAIILIPNGEIAFLYTRPFADCTNTVDIPQQVRYQFQPKGKLLN